MAGSVDPRRKDGDGTGKPSGSYVPIGSTPSTAAQRVVRALSTAKQTARLAGRMAIDKLPIDRAHKIRFKYYVLSVVGPLFGVSRGYLKNYIGGPAQRLVAVKERYRELATTARGADENAPPRTVSIVIPVFNQLKYTLGCIEAIHQNTTELDYEIIVVDDCSTDETPEALSARDDIVYVRNDKNLGFVGSCNAGANRARNTYLCFLNNDTAVLPYWLSALVNTFELHENVGLAGSKLVYPDGRLQESGGLVWGDGSAWNWGRLKNPDNPRFNYARHADYCSGASIVVPRVLFERLGGFDPLYTPAYCEDTDLAFKIRAIGLATIYQPLSQVEHFEGVTSGTDTTQGVKKYQVENLEKLAKRWTPARVNQGSSENADRLCDRGIVGRILVLDQITPEPDRDAGSVAALEIFLALRSLGYKITFVPCSNMCDLPPYTDLLGGIGVESVLLPWSRSVKQHLKEHGSSYDAVMIFRPETWHHHIDEVRNLAPQAKIIFHACDLHFLRHQREAESVGGGARTLEAEKNAELDMIAAADICTIHSSVEKELIEKERPGTRVVVVPIIFEPRSKGKPMEDRSGIIFVGGYRHPPNIDAVEYYLSEIHPSVMEGLPEPATFTAAGNAPPAELTALEGPNISVPGFVEDLEPLLSEARVMVAPLRYGAGVKGKILAAMAHGLPVVTTSVGAEGIAQDEEMLIADDASSFADAVCRLYTDSALWHRLRDASLDYLRDNTSRNAALSAMADVLQQLELPYLEARVPRSQDATTPCNFGSPSALSDVSALAAAARAALTEGREVDLVLVPDAVAAAAPDQSIATVVPYSAAGTHLAAAKAVVAIADATQPQSVAALGTALAEHLVSDAECAVIVAPPRMIATMDGYRVKSAFADTEIQAIELPYHETLSGFFDIPGRTGSWQIDRSLVGYPSLAIFHIPA